MKSIICWKKSILYQCLQSADFAICRYTFSGGARSAGEKAPGRGENAWACRAALIINALGLKKITDLDHHDILENFFLDIMVICECKFFRPSAARQAHAFSPRPDAFSPADRGWCLSPKRNLTRNSFFFLISSSL